MTAFLCACGSEAKVKTAGVWRCYTCARAWLLGPLRGAAIVALITWSALMPLWLPRFVP